MNVEMDAQHVNIERELRVGDNCNLVGGFSIILRGVVVIIAFSTLLVKWQLEKNKRASIVWGMDVSKQIVGSCVMHICNLVVSIVLGNKSKQNSNPCAWYTINLFLDCTFGVVLVYGILKLHASVSAWFGVKQLESGYYGDPINYWNWINQCIVFISALLLMKALVVFCIKSLSIFLHIGEFILLPSKLMDSANFEIFYVLVVLPLVLNIIEFLLVDQIIKRKSKGEEYLDLGQKSVVRDFRRSSTEDELFSNETKISYEPFYKRADLIDSIKEDRH